MNGVSYDIFCMNEPNYIMKITSTYDGLIVKDGKRESKRQYEKDGEMVQKVFQYFEPFSKNFDFRHCIDDHNNLRHQIPEIEASWTTHRWMCIAFAFILGVVEVNCFLVFNYFVWDGNERIARRLYADPGVHELHLGTLPLHLLQRRRAN